MQDMKLLDLASLATYIATFAQVTIEWEMIDIIVAKRMSKVQSPVTKDLVRPDFVRRTKYFS